MKDKIDAEEKNFINLGVVLNEKNEVLMIRRRKKEIGKDSAVLEWAFPGGKQRLSETREGCVKREILAETGYDVIPIKQIALRFHPQFFPVMIVYHLCKLASLKQIAEPQEPHEVAEIRWVKITEIRNLITTSLDPDVARELRI